ncbi:MAG: glycine cleavage system aminomethyltransferase GcvT [Chloroflexota bacterium]|nr:glycine cleavage system aminomethyltransferase GcvT [Chloroflexota bacterium]
MQASHQNQALDILDPGLFELIHLEQERQARRLIMIPSESIAPLAIRNTLGSCFTNIYAEGYPRPETRNFTEDEILDYTKAIGTYRRYSDPRYYKGVEYVDVVEALARRRCAEAFATNGLKAEDLYVNVQPLSGAPANNAVYTAFLSPGDTIMGMNLLHGGHLSHGSPVNRSGIIYDAQHYSVNPKTELLDYDAILEQAIRIQPKIIIAGYSSYPWVPDWQKFREIADKVGALLMTDVSHIAGLITAGQIPSPVGTAHIITFTTHKTMIGPRGACIITDNPKLANKIDKAVFPGEQGGPHINTIAALALTFKLAKTKEFEQLQTQIIKNAIAFANQLKAHNIRVPYGGTDTHIALLDCKSIKAKDGAYLSGDIGVRILDAAGIVANRNTMPGDRSAFSATGVRFGSTWLTQRGFKEGEFRAIANVIADLFENTTPYNMPGSSSPKRRAKVEFKALEKAKLEVESLAEKAIDFDTTLKKHGYPHFYNINDNVDTEWASFRLSGDQIRLFLSYTVSSDIEGLANGDSQPTLIHTSAGDVEGVIKSEGPSSFILTVSGNEAGLASAWMRDLSDAYIKFDQDLFMRVPGPMRIEGVQAEIPIISKNNRISNLKPFYIGIRKDKHNGEPLPPFIWEPESLEILQKTPLNEIHREMGAKMVPFAGWDMPVWYSSVLEEHLAVRQAAGLFDVTHMGVYQTEGPDAGVFLDSVCGNDITSLAVGESCYTQFLDHDANVIDDLLVYRRGKEKFLAVVNAANDDKDWAWLNGVREGKYRVDNETTWAVAFGKNVTLRNLRSEQAGSDRRVDIALQGPKSHDILLKLDCSPENRQAILGLKWAQLCEVKLNGIDLIISRTGYTGERMGFELFVHPEKAVALWQALLKVGENLGLKPCGLGARDSLRTEAGLPLYGHEMGGMLNLGVGQAGFSRFVKTYKPWFVGRQAYLQQEANRDSVVVRFKFHEKHTRMAHLGDPVIDNHGKVIGTVTSCAVNSEGSLTGQAYVSKKFAKEGTELLIFQGSPQTAGKAPSDLTLGDRVTLPTRVTIIKRFPK